MQVSKLLLQPHELPLFPSNLKPGLDVLITGLTCGKIVDAVNNGRVEAILEGETELEAIGVSGLLNNQDIGDTQLKKLFIASMTPIVGIQECRARDFCSHQSRDVAAGHGGGSCWDQSWGDREWCSRSAWRD